MAATGTQPYGQRSRFERRLESCHEVLELSTVEFAPRPCDDGRGCIGLEYAKQLGEFPHLQLRFYDHTFGSGVDSLENEQLGRGLFRDHLGQLTTLRQARIVPPRRPHSTGTPGRLRG